jgi:uncharacterized protein (TIGR00251 family)
MIEVTAHAEGCVLAVRAQPGARRNGLVGEHNGAMKVAVTAPADRGRANTALEVVLAKALGVKKSQVALLSGPTSRDKRFLLRSVTVEQVCQQLKQVVGE